MLHDSEWRQAKIELTEQEATANVLVVLIPSLIFFNVGSKVRIDHADIRVVEPKANCHSTLVSLKQVGKNPVYLMLQEKKKRVELNDSTAVLELRYFKCAYLNRFDSL